MTPFQEDQLTIRQLREENRRLEATMKAIHTRELRNEHIRRRLEQCVIVSIATIMVLAFLVVANVAHGQNASGQMREQPRTGYVPRDLPRVEDLPLHGTCWACMHGCTRAENIKNCGLDPGPATQEQVDCWLYQTQNNGAPCYKRREPETNYICHDEPDPNQGRVCVPK
jgi:hypothetical protein